MSAYSTVDTSKLGPANHKALILEALCRMKGDDLYRARAAFKGLTSEQMKEQHGYSGRTRRATRSCSSLIVQPSFHADDHQVFLHMGNTVLNVTAYSHDLVGLYEKMPDVAEDYVKRLNQMARDSRECLKRLKENKKEKVVASED